MVCHGAGMCRVNRIVYGCIRRARFVYAVETGHLSSGWALRTRPCVLYTVVSVRNCFRDRPGARTPTPKMTLTFCSIARGRRERPGSSPFICTAEICTSALSALSVIYKKTALRGSSWTSEANNLHLGICAKMPLFCNFVPSAVFLAIRRKQIRLVKPIAELI